MIPTRAGLLICILPICMGLGPSEPTSTSAPARPTLTIHEAAITASCVTSLVATSVTCWPINTSRSAFVVQTAMRLPNSTTTSSEIEKRDEPASVRCVQYFEKVTSCGIGVHPQPTLDGNPTTTTIITTPTPNASPITSTLTTSYAMSIGIVDGTAANAFGDNWRMVMTGELRDKVVNIANSYCEGLQKHKRDLPELGNADGDIEMVACDLRPLAEEQQNALQDEVENLLEGETADIPPTAVDAYAAAGIPRQAAQRAIGGAFAIWFRQQLAIGVAVVVAAEVVLSRTEFLQEPEVISSSSKTTADPTSTSSSSSSSSTTLQLCPMCTSCKPAALDDDEGQVGWTIPTRGPVIPISTTDSTISTTSSISTTASGTPTFTYRCFNRVEPHETITHNQGPWCDCPDGSYYTSQSVITTGDSTYTDYCPYITPPPTSFSWSPRSYDLPHISCDGNQGRDYGMVKEDLVEIGKSFCWDASVKIWYADAHVPYWTRYPPTVNWLLDPPGPTPTVFKPQKEVSIPEPRKKKNRVRAAVQVRYDFDACENPSDPNEVAFTNKYWCEDQLALLYDECGFTHHRLKTGHEADFYSGGSVRSDCIFWEIFMVTKGDQRVSDALANGGNLGKFAAVGGNSSMRWNSSSDLWDAILREGDDGDDGDGDDDDDVEEVWEGISVGDVRKWNSTFFF